MLHANNVRAVSIYSGWLERKLPASVRGWQNAHRQRSSCRTNSVALVGLPLQVSLYVIVYQRCILFFVCHVRLAG